MLPLYHTKAKRLRIHDQLYAAGERLLKRFDPCKIEVENGKVTCYSTRTGWHKAELCCGGCNHLSKRGCSVKALWCKLWLCTDVAETPEGKVVAAAFECLTKVAEHYHLLSFRASKEQLFQIETIRMIN